MNPEPIAHAAVAPSRLDNRALILGAAGKLFAEKGFQATTLRDIANGSGANGALVSYYFGGKEGLRDAVLDEKIRNLAELGEEAGSGREALGLTLRGIFRLLKEDPNFHLLAQRALTGEENFRAKMNEGYWTPLLTTLSLKIQNASALSPSQAEIRAIVLFGLIQQYGNMLCYPGLTPVGALAEFEVLVTGPILAGLLA